MVSLWQRRSESTNYFLCRTFPFTYNRLYCMLRHHRRQKLKTIFMEVGNVHRANRTIGCDRMIETAPIFLDSEWRLSCASEKNLLGIPTEYPRRTITLGSTGHRAEDSRLNRSFSVTPITKRLAIKSIFRCCIVRLKRSPRKECCHIRRFAGI